MRADLALLNTARDTGIRPDRGKHQAKTRDGRHYFCANVQNKGSHPRTGERASLEPSSRFPALPSRPAKFKSLSRNRDISRCAPLVSLISSFSRRKILLHIYKFESKNASAKTKYRGARARPDETEIRADDRCSADARARSRPRPLTDGAALARSAIRRRMRQARSRRTNGVGRGK